VSATVEEHAEQQPDAGGDAHRLPGVAAHIVLGVARGVAGAVEQLFFAARTESAARSRASAARSPTRPDVSRSKDSASSTTRRRSSRMRSVSGVVLIGGLPGGARAPLRSVRPS
jgi:hypothetical protein